MNIALPTYEFVSPLRMTGQAFSDLLVVLAQEAHNHNDSTDPTDEREQQYERGGLETMAFAISCLVAQRYNASVPTCVVMDTLCMGDRMNDDARRALVRGLLQGNGD